MYSGYYPIRYMTCKYFLSYCMLSFYFFDTCMHRSFQFWWSPIIFSFFFASGFDIIFINQLSDTRMQRFTSMLSSMNFLAIPILILYVWSRRLSSFFYLCTSMWPQHQLLKWLFFSRWIILTPLMKINWPYMYEFISVFLSLFHWVTSLNIIMPVALFWHSSFVVSFQIKKCVSFCFVLVQDHLVLWGPLEFPHEF